MLYLLVIMGWIGTISANGIQDAMIDGTEDLLNRGRFTAAFERALGSIEQLKSTVGTWSDTEMSRAVDCLKILIYAARFRDGEALMESMQKKHSPKSQLQRALFHAAKCDWFKAKMQMDHLIREYDALCKVAGDNSNSIPTIAAIQNSGRIDYACALILKTDAVEAKAQFQLLRQAFENNNSNHVHLCMLLKLEAALAIQEERLDDAETFLTRAIKVSEVSKFEGHPELLEAHIMLARVYTGKQMYEKAQRAIAIAQTRFAEQLTVNYIVNASVYLTLAVAMKLGGGNPVEVERLYKKSIELQVDKRDRNRFELHAAYHNLGTFYFENGRLQDAEKSLLKGLSLAEALHGKNSAEVLRFLDLLAEVYLKMKDFPAASKTLQRAIEIRGGN